MNVLKTSKHTDYMPFNIVYLLEIFRRISKNPLTERMKVHRPSSLGGCISVRASPDDAHPDRSTNLSRFLLVRVVMWRNIRTFGVDQEIELE